MSLKAIYIDLEVKRRGLAPGRVKVCTPEQIAEGVDVLRNGIVYHEEFPLNSLMGKDDSGNVYVDLDALDSALM